MSLHLEFGDSFPLPVILPMLFSLPLGTPYLILNALYSLGVKY